MRVQSGLVTGSGAAEMDALLPGGELREAALSDGRIGVDAMPSLTEEMQVRKWTVIQRQQHAELNCKVLIVDPRRTAPCSPFNSSAARQEPV